MKNANTYTSQEVKNYSKHYSDEKFEEKTRLSFFRMGRKLCYDVMLLWYVLKSSSVKDKILIVGALGYFILPIDLIPDGIPILGFTDDAAVISTVLGIIGDNITPDVRKKAEAKVNKMFN